LSFWRDAQFDTIRLCLIKVAARVTEMVTRIILAGFTSSHRSVVHPVHNESEFLPDPRDRLRWGAHPENSKEAEYLLTPLDRLAELKRVFQIDFDACPFPRKEGYDSLTEEWGKRTFVNAMFRDMGPFVTKAIVEYRAGKFVLIVLPLYQMGFIARLLCAGAVVYDLDIPAWRSIRDGVSTNPAPAKSRQPCVWLLLDPEKKSSGIALMRAEGRWHGRGLDYATPQELFAELDREFHFTLDVAANAQNAKCANFFTPEIDGLTQNWGQSRCWGNYPYGPALAAWMRKAYESSLAGATVVSLVPVSTDASWWWDYAVRGEIRYIKETVRFIEPDGETVVLMRPSAIVIFRPPGDPKRIGKHCCPNCGHWLAEGARVAAGGGSAHGF
jgi:phage N-6-adenine-methyltransferase